MTQGKFQTATEIVAHMFDCFNKGDIATVVSYIAENCVVREAPSLPYPGEFRGPAGYKNLITTVLGTWRSFKAIPEKIVGDDTMVFVLSRASGRGGPKDTAFDMPLVEIFTVENGKVVEVLPLYWDTKRLADIFSGAQ